MHAASIRADRGACATVVPRRERCDRVPWIYERFSLQLHQVSCHGGHVCSWIQQHLPGEAVHPHGHLPQANGLPQAQRFGKSLKRQLMRLLPVHDRLHQTRIDSVHTGGRRNMLVEYCQLRQDVSPTGDFIYAHRHSSDRGFGSLQAPARRPGAQPKRIGIGGTPLTGSTSLVPSGAPCFAPQRASRCSRSPSSGPSRPPSSWARSAIRRATSRAARRSGSQASRSSCARAGSSAAGRTSRSGAGPNCGASSTVRRPQRHDGRDLPRGLAPPAPEQRRKAAPSARGDHAQGGQAHVRRFCDAVELRGLMRPGCDLTTRVLLVSGAPA